jgi:protein-disulfide isomerase
MADRGMEKVGCHIERLDSRGQNPEGQNRLRKALGRNLADQIGVSAGATSTGHERSVNIVPEHGENRFRQMANHTGMENLEMRLRITAMAALVLMSISAFGADNPALRPPAGSKVAIVVFEDLECPSCSSAEPVIKDAEKTEQVPLVRHDFPIPQHKWSADAHVFARYFDTVSPAVGEEYRHWVFTNQRSINKSNLREMTNRFASEHKTALPLFVDPSGQLKAKVTADFNLGQQLGVSQTPTVYVVGDVKNSPSSIPVTDMTQLVSTIDTMKQQVAAETPAKSTKPTKSSTAKSAKKK